MNTEYKQTTLPKVSIITPTKNRCLLLQETIKSVQVQTYSNWELFIIDDGSTDGTHQFILNLCNQDPRIHFMERVGSQSGAPVCRNQGFRASTGEYIIFLDSDDLLAPYCLEQRVTVFFNNPYYDFIVFPMLVFDKRMGDSKVLWNINTDQNDLTRFLSFDTPWQTTCPIWKRDAVAAVGPWDEEALTWQDWEFHMRALINDLEYFQANAIPDCFLRRDATSDRISAGDTKEERFFSRFKTFEKIYKLLVEHGKLNDVNRRGFAGLYFNNAENAALRNKHELAYLFLDALDRNKLLNPKTFTFIKFYINVLLQTKKSGFPMATSLTYRTAQKILPPSLLGRKSNQLKHTLNEQVAEKMCL